MSVKELARELYPEDLFGYAEKLTEGELKVLKHLRQELEARVRPVLIDSYEKALLPREEILGAFAAAKIMTHPDLFVGREGSWKAGELYNAFLYLEMARFDPSVATFYTVHGGLGYNTILIGGSQEQIERFGTPVRNFEAQTCFGLTEPDHGSDIAGGLATTAERKGDVWVLNGEKRWIGGAKTADFIPIFARDVETKKIKCFMVKQGSPGLSVENVEHKISLRIVNNGHITLKDVEVPEADRLVNINGYGDVAKIFVRTRADVAYIAMGTAAGAFNAALRLTTTREQFGRKLGGFQLVQEKLARMQANVQAAIAYSARIAEIQESGTEEMLNSSLAKLHNSLRMRETVALAREVCGGNGITYETEVARFFTDAEAIYTYEGTHEINAMIVARELTGIGAFV
ncbi:TPA: acyl-CoA dehydrogenase family protein [Streptococcus suis]|uniref:Glutaryl-CoA dehydrogenase n=1 Tax=Streptococcus suis TaxID=1307 RepID=A0A3R8R9B3_STRSU|nr:acyl-CoA dehydrogenase family protein [Streptococcus suis]MDW8743606.1 acyl-CoA dehydrogenase family protein [Streptococcus suis]NQG20107.1 glutaryl-CoA dehydrogenase [Streptococcus suis]NQH33479.1 glutaryl-CoA dehydrogenase [Streptococcus suis]NQH95693.1 glutaryl-CoA dehydrogenase [Streptococcus suis]NQI34961.1 glutaryl-CoA dehydrogenase [Streptococcus suis]